MGGVGTDRLAPTLLGQMVAKYAERSEEIPFQAPAPGAPDHTQRSAFRKSVVHTLLIREIQANMVVHQDIRTHKGILVVARGQEVTPAVLELLQLWATSREIVEPIEMLVPAPDG